MNGGDQSIIFENMKSHYLSRSLDKVLMVVICSTLIEDSQISRFKIRLVNRVVPSDFWGIHWLADFAGSDFDSNPIKI